MTTNTQTNEQPAGERAELVRDLRDYASDAGYSLCDYRDTMLKAAALLEAEAQRPALKPLTEGQIWSLIEYNRAGSLGLARLIERAHGIKEQS